MGSIPGLGSFACHAVWGETKQNISLRHVVREVFKFKNYNLPGIFCFVLFCFVFWLFCKSLFLSFFFLILFLNFTILYWFCHISKWICHRHTCVPHPEPSSLLPTHTIPLGHPSAPAPSIQYRASNLDWWLVSYMILYIFQCYSPKSSHPLPLAFFKESNYMELSWEYRHSYGDGQSVKERKE